jgi:hypothetical protein
MGFAFMALELFSQCLLSLFAASGKVIRLTAGAAF